MPVHCGGEQVESATEYDLQTILFERLHVSSFHIGMTSADKVGRLVSVAGRVYLLPPTSRQHSVIHVPSSTMSG